MIYREITIGKYTIKRYLVIYVNDDIDVIIDERMIRYPLFLRIRNLNNKGFHLLRCELLKQAKFVTIQKKYRRIKA